MAFFDVEWWRRAAFGAGALAAAGAGLAVAALDAVLAHGTLRELLSVEGDALGGLCAAAVSLCFLVAVAAVLSSCLLGRGWCWPGWVAGLCYGGLLFAGFDGPRPGHGSAASLMAVALYLTSIPFQLAVLTHRLAARSDWHRWADTSLYERLTLPRASR